MARRYWVNRELDHLVLYAYDDRRRPLSLPSREPTWRWADKLLAHMHLGSHPELDEIGEDEARELAREHGIEAESDADPPEEL